MTIARTAELVSIRLATFSALLDKVEAQWAGRDIEQLGRVRLAEDMHPLAWQVAAVAQQVLGLTAWLGGGTLPNSVPDVAGWAEARTRLADAAAGIAAVSREAMLPEGKRIDIEMIGMYLELSGERFVEEWFWPNFYFHLDMAYAIARSQGAAIGKAEVVTNLLPELRPIAPAPSA